MFVNVLAVSPIKFWNIFKYKQVVRSCKTCIAQAGSFLEYGNWFFQFRDFSEATGLCRSTEIVRFKIRLNFFTLNVVEGKMVFWQLITSWQLRLGCVNYALRGLSWICLYSLLKNIFKNSLFKYFHRAKNSNLSKRSSLCQEIACEKEISTDPVDSFDWQCGILTSWPSWRS